MKKVFYKLLSPITYHLSPITSQGQTLIEMLVALAIGVTLVTSAVVAVTTTLHNAQSVQYKTQATKYAQQGMEILQQIRDTDYASFQNYNGTYCLAQGLNTLGNVTISCTTPNVGRFIRAVEIQPDACAGSVSRVTVTVSWGDTSCAGNDFCQNVTIASCLSTVNPIQGP